MADPKLPRHGPGRAGDGNFVLSEFRAKSAAKKPPARASRSHSSGRRPTFRKTVSPSLPRSTARPTRAGPSCRKRGKITSPFSRPSSRSARPAARGGPRDRACLSRQRLHARAFSPVVDRCGQSARGRRVPASIRNRWPCWRPIQRIVASSEERLPRQCVAAIQGNEGSAGGAEKEPRRIAREGIPTSMVMDDMPATAHTFMLLRGQYDKRGEVKSRRASPRPCRRCRTRRTNRLGLARWLVDPGEPAGGPGGGESITGRCCSARECGQDGRRFRLAGGTAQPSGAD